VERPKGREEKGRGKGAGKCKQKYLGDRVLGQGKITSGQPPFSMSRRIIEEG